MASKSDLIYGPSARLKLVPSAIALCLAMSLGTFFVAYFNVNGMREPAGFAPCLMFLGIGAVFLLVYWHGCLRVTLADEEIVFERLVPSPRKIAAIRYADITKVEEKQMTLKMVLYSRDGQKPRAIPATLERVKGQFTLPDDPLEPAPDAGLLWERYKLREEIIRRSGAARAES